MDKPISVKRRREKVKVVQAVDTTTGEILDTSVQRESLDFYVNNEQFYMTYISILKVLEGTTPLEGLILQEMCFNCGYNDNTIHVSSGLRKSWSQKFGCTAQSISNSILGLKKKKLIMDLYVGSRGSFLVNPKYFFKGTAQGRNSALELMIQITTKLEKK
jgi:hypothetical protein